MCFIYKYSVQLFLSILIVIIMHTEAVSSSPITNDHIIKEYLAARQVYVYRSYKDMQIFHFRIPPHITNGVFNLTSNSTDGCDPRNVTVYLQAKSYPVISPDGAAFPELAWVNRQKVYQATLLSDLTPTILRIPNPQPGDWFMVAFIFDDSNRITQAGIFPSCHAWLKVEATYYEETDINILAPSSNKSQSYSSYLIEKSTYFSFFIPPEVWSVTVEVKKCSTLNESNKIDSSNLEDLLMCSILVIERPLALPFIGSSNSKMKNCSAEGFYDFCSLTFTPMPASWHYLSVTPIADPIWMKIAVILNVCGEDDEENFEFNPFPASFESELMFEEVNLEEKIQDLYNNINFNLSVNPSMNLNDIKNSLSKYGDKSLTTKSDDGTMSNTLEMLNEVVGDPLLDFKMHLEKRDVHFANDSGGNDTELVTLLGMEESWQQQSCWPSHQLTRKTFPGNFVYEFDFKPSSNGTVPLMLNLSNQVPTILNFDIQQIIDIGGTLSVDVAVSPFLNTTAHNYTVFGCLNVDIRPSIETGKDSLSCSQGHSFSVNTSSSTYFSTSVMIPYPEPGKWFLVFHPSCYLHNMSSLVPCTTNATTVIFSIASASCILGKCGDYGSCFQYISGGFIFSTCVCDVGYRGYDCSDGKDAIPNSRLLLSTLLLCLSNLLFFPAILLALYRKFYTEALVYTFTMFFSTFYHACDQDIYNFCLMRLSVLQFCDFYSAILSFWVTLIVMADLPSSIYSILHMAGAVIVALGVEYDRTGLWVFAIPSITAFAIMALGWIMHTKEKKSCYPPKRYWVSSLVPGTLLAATGLICYAFLETEDNYFLIHSFWHSIMALSILCLLPPARTISINKISEWNLHSVMHKRSPSTLTCDARQI